jgi:hypothetical protein
MALPYSKQKLRKQLRERFTNKTGLDYTDPSFLDWLSDNGYPEPKKPPEDPREKLSFRVVYSEPQEIKIGRIKVIGGGYNYPKIKIKRSNS